MNHTTKNKRISVVMAVYNGERFLKPTIASTLSQSFEDFEFIIVNDGSEDETQNIIAEYHDDRIILINNTRNMGQTASLNIGLQNARGTYIARTDAGDISTPERLKKQFQYLENHSDVDILGTAAFQYDMAGNLCGNVFMPNRPSTILQRIFFASPVVHVSVMMRRDRILELGGYDDSYRILADYGLWAQALQNGFRFWNLRDVLTGYLVDQDSFGSSHGRGRSIQEASQIICDLALALTGDTLSFDQAEDIYRFFVFGPQDLDSDRLRKNEALFEGLLLKLHTARRDIDYLLLRSYLKMLFGRRSYTSSQKHELKDVLHSILSKWRGGLSFHLFEDMHRYIQTFRYINFSTIGVKVPNFICEVADK
ncbi:MAG: glycosyltransferase [Deltaproteobacteria bacterium]|nr:glycosyltransferase [Deltaproteobacteria bacterium]